ncbi:MAG: hypothetical protein IT495_19465 [Gammaproteobacteria bacterium]|nr:hypothetical protein [Gammaproteobacteria bacterium]
MSLIARLLLTVAAPILAAAAWLGPLDTLGRDYTEAGLKRALATYAVVRVLNGVISVAQGTEVSLEPAGVGVTLTPGEILDPINDLVERFSWVVLVSGTSIGVQRVLLDVTAAPTMRLVGCGALLAGLVVLWWPGMRGTAAGRVILRLSALLVLLRFAVPVMAIGSDALYQAFLAPRYDASRAQLERTTATISALNAAATVVQRDEGELSLIENAKRAYAAAADAVDVRGRIDALRQAAADLSARAIDLIVVFVVQTMLVPLAFLWLVLAAARRLLAGRDPAP